MEILGFSLMYAGLVVIVAGKERWEVKAGIALLSIGSVILLLTT